MKFFNIFFIVFVPSKLLALKCEKDLYGKCVFTGVVTTKSNLFFHPTSVFESDMITNVQFHESTMYSFTDETCKNFMNLEIIFANNISLEKVTRNALNECTNLTQIDLSHNLLETLDKNLFIFNPNLTALWLNNNKLRKIDGKMFVPVKNLHILKVSTNYLTEIPLDEFPTLPQLTNFNFDENDIVELDEREFVVKFPKLEEISLHENLFECDRLHVILTFIEKKEIKVQKALNVNNRKRKFPISHTNKSFTCVTKEQQPAMILNQMQLLRRAHDKNLEILETETEQLQSNNSKLKWDLRFMYYAFTSFIAIDFMFFLYFNDDFRQIWKILFNRKEEESFEEEND